MRSEELIGLCAVHGVDHQRAARSAASSPDEGLRQAGRDVIMKKFSPDRRAVPVLIPPPKAGARGRENGAALQPSWTIAELGQAAAGVPELCFRAALFAYAGDYSGYWPLHRALYDEGLKLRELEGWSPVVLDVHGLERTYLAHLAKMVLDEDRSPNLFRVCPELYRIYLQVDEQTWLRSMAGRFSALKFVWLGWIGEAARIMQPRLSEEG